jgi:hypothetical protein
MADEVLTNRLNQWGQMMQQNPQTAKQVNWRKFGTISSQKMGVKDEGLMLSPAEVQANDRQNMQLQLDMEKQKNGPEFQPQMSEADRAVKILASVDQKSIEHTPILRMVLDRCGMMNPEINAALNAKNKIDAEMLAGRLSESDKAALEMDYGPQNTNGSGSSSPDDGGAGEGPGVTAAGGRLPVQPSGGVLQQNYRQRA